MSVSFTVPFAPNNAPANTRILVDGTMTASVALPAATGTAVTAGLNLQNATPFPTTETINVSLSTSASANGNSVNGTAWLQDSADNSSFANIVTLGTVNLVNGDSSQAAQSFTFKLPPGCRQYILGKVSYPANTANLSDASLTLQLCF
jgi:hypothetical protein